MDKSQGKEETYAGWFVVCFLFYFDYAGKGMLKGVLTLGKKCGLR